MKEVEYRLEVKTDGNSFNCGGSTEYDDQKWNKIVELCDYRKASITDLLADYLETLTPEKAEEILASWDM